MFIPVLAPPSFSTFWQRTEGSSEQSGYLPCGLHPATAQLRISPWQQGQKGCARHSWILVLGYPACFILGLKPSAFPSWGGGHGGWDLSTGSNWDRVRNAIVQTRTFVLKIVHKVLVPGIQRIQGFFQRQPESFSLPQVCLDWVKCLTVLLLNGWFPVVI